MARNASGTHSLPTGNPVVSGTAASSTVQNATMNDLSAEITDSLSRSGKGGMSAPLVITAGAVGAPSIAPTGDSDTGIYASAANEIAITTGGTQRFKASSAGVNVTGAMAATGAVSGTTGTFTGALEAVGLEAGTGAVNGTGMDAGSAKITNVANGTAATDAAAFGQVYSTAACTDGANWMTGPDAGGNVYRIGNMVFLVVKALADTSAAWTDICTVPTGFRPAATVENVLGVVIDADAVDYVATFEVSTLGVVSAKYADLAPGFGALPALAVNDSVFLRAVWLAA